MFWHNESFFDKNGKTIQLGTFICIDTHSFEVYSTLQSGLCIKDFDKFIKPNHLKIINRFSDMRTIYSLNDLDLSNILICDKKAFPECFI